MRKTSNIQRTATSHQRVRGVQKHLGRSASVWDGLSGASSGRTETLSAIKLGKVADHIRAALHVLGHDTRREGLLETPLRYAKFLDEFSLERPFKFTTFQAESDGMIVVSDVPVVSLCEHHMAPFVGIATVGYLPGAQMLGLSKIPRTVDYFARRLQNQERITTQVAHFLQEKLGARGVGVILRCRHSCMEMRGAKAHGAQTTTTVLIGAMKDDPTTRAEFLAHHKH